MPTLSSVGGVAPSQTLETTSWGRKVLQRKLEVPLPEAGARMMCRKKQHNFCFISVFPKLREGPAWGLGHSHTS